MISLSPSANRALFEAIHAVVGMALDTPQQLFSPYCGICKNVQCWLREYHPEFGHLAYHTLSAIFDDMGLPKAFPIPYIFSEDVGGDGDYCYWTGKYLKLRMDLCSKLMSYLDIQLVQTIFSEKHETLLPALKALSFLPSWAIVWTGMGICGNVGDLMVDPSGVYYQLEDTFREMGFEDPCTPISYFTGLKWVGEEGIARRKLLADLISFLEAKNVSTT